MHLRITGICTICVDSRYYIDNGSDKKKMCRKKYSFVILGHGFDSVDTIRAARVNYSPKAQFAKKLKVKAKKYLGRHQTDDGVYDAMLVRATEAVEATDELGKLDGSDELEVVVTNNDESESDAQSAPLP